MNQLTPRHSVGVDERHAPETAAVGFCIRRDRSLEIACRGDEPQLEIDHGAQQSRRSRPGGRREPASDRQMGLVEDPQGRCEDSPAAKLGEPLEFGDRCNPAANVMETVQRDFGSLPAA